MRTHGTASELERRRLLAVDRVRSDYTHQEVADFFGVWRQTVTKWMSAYRKKGRKGLKAKPHPGRVPKLTAEQEREVISWFARSPTEFGYATELWTGPRVADLIRRKLRVKFHPRYVNQWLAQRRITSQKPERRARERDDREVRRWLREEWPRIKKVLRGGVRIWF
jgi:transposase